MVSYYTHTVFTCVINILEKAQNEEGYSPYLIRQHKQLLLIGKVKDFFNALLALNLTWKRRPRASWSRTDDSIHKTIYQEHLTATSDQVLKQSPPFWASNFPYIKHTPVGFPGLMMQSTLGLQYCLAVWRALCSSLTSSAQQLSSSR